MKHTHPLSLVPLGNTFSFPPSNIHNTAFLMYSCPWIEGARERPSCSNTSPFWRENLRIRATSSAEKCGVASLLSCWMLFAMRIVLQRNTSNEYKKTEFDQYSRSSATGEFE